MDLSNFKSTGLKILRGLQRTLLGGGRGVEAMGRKSKGHIQEVLQGNTPRAMVGGGYSIDSAV